MKEILNKIRTAFPDLSHDFLLLLAERAHANQMSKEQLQKAILHVIDHCKYPKPTIAQFLSSSEPLKLYNYSEMMKLHAGQKDIFRVYKSVRISGSTSPLWVSPEDFEQFNLDPWNKNE